MGTFNEGYNTTRLDALADPTQCALDEALMQSLGVNTVSVYYVDNTLDHTECIKILESHGIYVILGLSTPDNYIHLVSQKTLQDTINLGELINSAETKALVTTILNTRVVQYIHPDSLRVLPVQ